MMKQEKPQKMDRRHLWAAFTMAGAAFFLLFGYEFMRSTTNTLFKADFGAENLAVIMAIMPFGVLGCVYLYARILSKFGAHRTLLVTTLGSAAIIAACYVLTSSGYRWASATAYVFRDIYVVILIEQFWSFINSRITQESAKKLNGPVIGVSCIGGILGGLTMYHLIDSFGTHAMLLFAAGSLLPAALLSDIAFRKCGDPPGAKSDKEGKHGHLALPVFKQNPILIVLILIVITTQIVSATLGLNFQITLQNEMPDMLQQTKYSSAFFAWLNTGAAILQFLLVPLALRFLSLKVVHMLIPLVHIASCITMLFYPSLTSAGLAYLLFKCLDYSLFKAAKEILYIPLSFDVRYRCKEVIDVFGYRFGKGGSSFVIASLQKMGIIVATVSRNGGYAVSTSYGAVALGASVLWLGLAGGPLKKHLPK